MLLALPTNAVLAQAQPEAALQSSHDRQRFYRSTGDVLLHNEQRTTLAWTAATHESHQREVITDGAAFTPRSSTRGEVHPRGVMVENAYVNVM